MPSSTTSAAAEPRSGDLPSLFYFGHSDRLIWGLGLVGMVLAAALMAGYANVFMLLALWLVQLSFVNSGQLFYGYGWETQLLELTFLVLPGSRLGSAVETGDGSSAANCDLGPAVDVVSTDARGGADQDPQRFVLAGF